MTVVEVVERQLCLSTNRETTMSLCWLITSLRELRMILVSGLTFAVITDRCWFMIDNATFKPRCQSMDVSDTLKPVYHFATLRGYVPKTTVARKCRPCATQLLRNNVTRCIKGLTKHGPVWHYLMLDVCFTALDAMCRLSVVHPHVLWTNLQTQEENVRWFEVN